MTLGTVVRENARSAPGRIALRCGATSITYADLELRTRRLAGALKSAGVKRGDRIAWIAQNCHAWVEVLIAAARVGAVLGSMNWRQTPGELAAVLTDWQPRIVFWQLTDTGALASTLRESAPEARWVCTDSADAEGYDAFLASGEPSGDDEDDSTAPVLAMFVGDASGGCSGALLTHTNLLVPGLVMALVQQIDERTVNLASAPLFHIASLFTLIPTLQMRGTNVMVRRADAALICAAIQQHRCTHGFLFGPTADAIVEVNANGQYDLKSFRSSLPTPRWQAMVTRDESPWGLRSGGYGQTETGMVVLAALGEGGSSTSGRTAPYAEVRIVDADDRDVPDRETGQIVARGASVHAGYWNRDAINRERFRNGWWHTGDLGRREREGAVTFIGPMGRMIKSGAENIDATEVERCIGRHPAVLEAAVIGVPDEVWIQAVKAIVVVRPGAALTEDELLEHCRQYLASYKKPRSIVFQCEPLPRIGGLLAYAKLDALHGGGNYPGEGTRST
jgi:long-chain acyl-CoA synthetase